MSSSLTPPVLHQAHRHSYGLGEFGHQSPSLSLHVPPPMPIRRTSAGARPGRPTSQTFRPSPLAGPVVSYDSLLELASASTPTTGKPQKSASADALSGIVPRRKSILAAYTRLPVVVIGDAAYPDCPLGAGPESRPAARRFASASSTASASTSADSTLLTPTPATSLLSARSSATSLSSQSGSSVVSVHIRTSVNAAAKPANTSAELKGPKKPPEVKHNWLAANPTPLFSRSALRTQGVVMPVRASVSAPSTRSRSGPGARSVRSSRSVSSGETAREVLSVTEKGKEKDKDMVVEVTVEGTKIERKVERSSRLARSRTLSTAPNLDTSLSLRRRMTRAGGAAAGTVEEMGKEWSATATEGGDMGKRTRRMSLTWAFSLAQGQVQRRRTTAAAGPLTSTPTPVSVVHTSASEGTRVCGAGPTKADELEAGETALSSSSSSSSSSVSSLTSSILVPALASSSTSTSTSTSVADITTVSAPPSQSTKPAMTPLVATTMPAAEGSLRRVWKKLRRLSSVRADVNLASKENSKMKPDSNPKPNPKLKHDHASDVSDAGREHKLEYESKLGQLEVELGLGVELGLELGPGLNNEGEPELEVEVAPVPEPVVGVETKAERGETEQPQRSCPRSRSRSFFAGLSFGLGSCSMVRRATGRSSR